MEVLIELGHEQRNKNNVTYDKVRVAELKDHVVH